MKPSAYNIRIYGLFLNPNGEILLTDERRGGYHMTKFPGGGHELGEGLAAGLMREFREELEMEIAVKELFYTNEFLQISAFNPKDQLISFYYWVDIPRWDEIPVVQAQFGFPQGKQDAQTFRWVLVDQLKAEDLTFPVDKIVIARIQKMSENL